MNLNRELQRLMLKELRDFYPSRSQSAYQMAGYTQAECIANLIYLEEHGLAESGISHSNTSGAAIITQARISAKGLDFLEDDGGIGAILGTVTIKFHEDTLLRLIAARLDDADLPDNEKKGILQALREAPAEATKQLITKLLDLGMENAGKAIPLLQTLIQGSHL